MPASRNQQDLVRMAEALYGERWTRALARDLGMGQAMAYRWKAGLYEPSDEVVERVRKLCLERSEGLRRAAR